MAEKPAARILQVTLSEIVDLGNETRHFQLSLGAGEEIDFIAGQFVAVLCPKEGKIIRRAYSIASPPEIKDHLDLIVKQVEGGVVTHWFWALKRGDRFQIHGPLGKFLLPSQIDFDIGFVAVGTGIAPFRSMIRHLLATGFHRRLWLLFGTRYDRMIPYHEEWLRLAQEHPNLTYIPTISRPSPAWKGEAGYVQTKIEKLFPRPEGKRIYICGLNEMIQAVQEAALKQGFKRDQIAYEKYD
ncbi:MAG: FAD-dependent oxidoreductase [Candidatus Omnitrophica bacterium]|nr:FAD-dependent oxidoreductase [Candidatus Omnitrophota bacterium]